jgi:hypothetical protein
MEVSVLTEEINDYSLVTALYIFSKAIFASKGYVQENTV